MEISQADFQIKKLNFSRGISLEQFTVKADSPKKMYVEVDQDRFGFFFCLSGSNHVNIEGSNKKVHIRGGVCGAYIEAKRIVSVAEYCAGEPFSIISITTPPATLKELFKLDIHNLPIPIHNKADVQEHGLYVHFTQSRRHINRSIYQIANPPIDGHFVPIFTECKIIEVLSLMLNEIYYGRRGHGYPPSLTSLEIDRLFKIRDMLIKNISAPPSLIELAHNYGFTHNKLNRGFKEMFGTTVYEYLRDQRLEKARELLLSGDYNVTEACLDVGYSNLSHFAKMYRQKFGERPNDSRKRFFPTN